MKKLNILNPLVFWSMVVVFIFSVIFIYDISIKSEKNHVNSTVSSFENHSYSQKEDMFPDINVKLEPENKFDLVKFFNLNNNLLLLLLLIYSVALSILFTYREKSRISNEMLNERIQIEKERIQSKVNIYENIEQELSKYEYILSPELNIKNLDKKIDEDINTILFSSRVVLEKILLYICQKENISEEILSKMIGILFRKQILDYQATNYAHTIKAFGNRVAHPNLKNPMQFSSKDALLVLSSLVTLINILDSKKLLQGLENVN